MVFQGSLLTDPNDTLNIDEDTSASGNLLVGALTTNGSITISSFIIEGDSVTYAVGDTANITGVGQLIISADGNYTFIPVENYNGPVPLITYTLNDGQTTDTSTLTITINPVIDSFVDANEVVSTNEDTPISGSVLNGTSSIEGNVTVVSFTLVGDNTTYNAGDTAIITGVGTLLLNSNGSYTFNPANNYNGPVPVATYLLTDGSSNDTSTLTISIIPIDHDLDITIVSTPLNVYESALQDGSGGNEITDEGTLSITANDGLARIEITHIGGTSITINLAALLAASIANPITLTGDYGTLAITGYANGQLAYSYTLSQAQNHLGPASEQLQDFFDFTAFDQDGDNDTERLTTNIHDDIGTAYNDTNTVTVLTDSFSIDGIKGEWSLPVDGKEVKRFDGPDNDIGFDQIRWGVTSGSQSGYGFADNDNALNGEIPLNQEITLGVFSHYNYAIQSGSISAVTLNINFTVTDVHGVTTPVNLDINFQHNETPNGGADPRDIITIGETNVTFTFEGNQYTVQVIGFKDVNTGEVVSTIYTAEGATTSYNLVVRIVEGTDYVLPSTTGNVLTNDTSGADTNMIVISAGPDGQSETTILAGDQQILTGLYGTLKIESDGKYTYQVTANANTIPDGAQEIFSYTMTDGDGDASSAKLTIDVNTTEQAAPQPPAVQSLIEEDKSLLLTEDIQESNSHNDGLHAQTTDNNSKTHQISKVEFTVIENFDPQTNIIDLSDVLVDEENGSIHEYLSLEINNGSSILSIDTNGAAEGGGNMDIVLTNLDLTQFYNTADSADKLELSIVNQLIESNTIIIDTLSMNTGGTQILDPNLIP